MYHYILFLLQSGIPLEHMVLHLKLKLCWSTLHHISPMHMSDSTSMSTSLHSDTSVTFILEIAYCLTRISHPICGHNSHIPVLQILMNLLQISPIIYLEWVHLSVMLYHC